MEVAMRHIISLLLQNEAGALSRVAGMFAARGFNIESLSVAPTQDPTLSRVTLVTTGTDAVVSQMNKQLFKMVDVVRIDDLTAGDHIERELLLLKLGVTAEQRDQVRENALNSHARIIDDSETSYTVELVGTQQEIDHFIVEQTAFATLLEVVRTGVAGIDRSGQPA